jgi:hypothetical protein
MNNDLTLHQRRRSPSAAELASIPWLQVLKDEDQSWVNSQIVVGDALAVDVVCRIGKAPT